MAKLVIIKKLSLIIILSCPVFAAADQSVNNVITVKNDVSMVATNPVCKITRHALSLRQVMSDVAIEARQRINYQPEIDDIKNLKHYQAQKNLPPMITEYDLENLDRACSLDRNKNYRLDTLGGWYG